MANNAKQMLVNDDYELTWEVDGGVHTVKLTKLSEPSDPAKMVLEREDKESWTHTE